MPTFKPHCARWPQLGPLRMRSSTHHLLKSFVRKWSCESGGNGPDEAKGAACAVHYQNVLDKGAFSRLTCRASAVVACASVVLEWCGKRQLRRGLWRRSTTADHCDHHIGDCGITRTIVSIQEGSGAGGSGLGWAWGDATGPGAGGAHGSGVGDILRAGWGQAEPLFRCLKTPQTRRAKIDT